MSGHIKTHVALDETYEEAERRRKRAEADDAGWMGTIVGLSIAFATLGALTLMH